MQCEPFLNNQCRNIKCSYYDFYKDTVYLRMTDGGVCPTFDTVCIVHFINIP